MTFRVVRTNQYNQDLGIIHSTNGNHLESPKEGSSIDHQVTIYLHAQNITMFPTNETCSTTQRHTLLLHILITPRGSRLPTYLPSGSISTSPRRHLPKLKGLPRIIGKKGTTTQLCSKISMNNQNPNQSDSAGYHDSVTTMDSQHGDSAGKSRLNDYQITREQEHSTNSSRKSTALPAHSELNKTARTNMKLQPTKPYLNSSGKIQQNGARSYQLTQLNPTSQTRLNHKGGHGVLLQQALRGPHRQSEYTHQQDYHLHHFNIQPLRVTVLPAPATTAGALPAGPPPGPAVPNLTSHGPNVVARGSTTLVKETHRAAAEHTAEGVLNAAADISSFAIQISPVVSTAESNFFSSDISCSTADSPDVKVADPPVVSTADSAEVKVADPPVVSTADSADFLLHQLVHIPLALQLVDIHVYKQILLFDKHHR
ncbi:hypothetical protein F511_36576 [Dorcoceras hygrometricum]|uniref:Uncharacterized protein n=1 Tax=Dorcoceras hygrometricum TaxID=472368 RepID=A0A2Z7AWF8_9LAMI|nr:hypothetical protein F511_36576 [Dorcoceras hygrometricum]